MRSANPSTIAVLPTPGSPMRTGLFLVRRLRTWIVRRISSSRAMTGSSFPAPAAPGAAAEDLDRAADLLVAADDRIKLSGARLLGEVAAVLLERLVGRLGVLARH